MIQGFETVQSIDEHRKINIECAIAAQLFVFAAKLILHGIADHFTELNNEVMHLGLPNLG